MLRRLLLLCRARLSAVALASSAPRNGARKWTAQQAYHLPDGLASILSPRPPYMPVGVCDDAGGACAHACDTVHATRKTA